MLEVRTTVSTTNLGGTQCIPLLMKREFSIIVNWALGRKFGGQILPSFLVGGHQGIVGWLCVVQGVV
jgi:hypothetical protein